MHNSQDNRASKEADIANQVAVQIVNNNNMLNIKQQNKANISKPQKWSVKKIYQMYNTRHNIIKMEEIIQDNNNQVYKINLAVNALVLHNLLITMVNMVIMVGIVDMDRITIIIVVDIFKMLQPDYGNAQYI